MNCGRQVCCLSTSSIVVQSVNIEFVISVLVPVLSNVSFQRRSIALKIFQVIDHNYRYQKTWIVWHVPIYSISIENVGTRLILRLDSKWMQMVFIISHRLRAILNINFAFKKIEILRSLEPAFELCWEGNEQDQYKTELYRRNKTRNTNITYEEGIYPAGHASPLWNPVTLDDLKSQIKWLAKMRFFILWMIIIYPYGSQFGITLGSIWTNGISDHPRSDPN